MIQPRPDAPLGSVQTLPSYNAQTFPATAAILCRNTAPLIDFAFALLQRGVACHVVGRDILVGLEKLIDKVAGSAGVSCSTPEFRLALAKHRDSESDKLVRKGKRQQAENLTDRCDALLLLSANANTVADVKARLTRIFAAGPGVTLSTIHKAKGLEWETVFILDWHLLPSRYAESPTELQQEKNLQYVAVTRAKLDLRFVRSGCWRA